MKIVGPTIVKPWRGQIDGAKTLKRLRELLQRMQRYRVLDPACGCGNVLYVSYRELKRLEARLYERMAEFSREAEPGQMRLSYVTGQNFYGLDILPFAIEIAKVTMMIARKLAIDELHNTEKALPLDNLDQNFIATDALLTPEGLPAKWPKADVIVGNPPFLGAKKLNPVRGVDYVNTLRRAYAEVPGMADYCVYWLRKAHDHLPVCTAADPVAGRAGLVGTNNIRNLYARLGGLDHVAKSGKLGVGCRYSAESVFDTFPWPQFDVSPSAVRRDIVVESTAPKRRSSVGATSSDHAAPDELNPNSPPQATKMPPLTGLRGAAFTPLQHSIREPARSDLKVALRKSPHRPATPSPKLMPWPPPRGTCAALDAAVLAAYGFRAKEDLLAQLLALNQQVAARIERGEPVTAPGIPPGYPDPQQLVTQDCIQPPGKDWESAYAAPTMKPVHPSLTPEPAYRDAAHFYSAMEEGPPYRTK